MSASHAADFSGGSHHDALLGLRDLPFLKDRYTVEYLWLGGNDGDLRSKTRTIEGPIRSIADSKSVCFDDNDKKKETKPQSGGTTPPGVYSYRSAE